MNRGDAARAAVKQSGGTPPRGSRHHLVERLALTEDHRQIRYEVTIERECGAMEKNNEQNDDGGGVHVQCVESPDGELTVTIRTLTDGELDGWQRVP